MYSFEWDHASSNNHTALHNIGDVTVNVIEGLYTQAKSKVLTNSKSGKAFDTKVEVRQLLLCLLLHTLCDVFFENIITEASEEPKTGMIVGV